MVRAAVARRPLRRSPTSRQTPLRHPAPLGARAPGVVCRTVTPPGSRAPTKLLQQAAQANAGLYRRRSPRRRSTRGLPRRRERGRCVARRAALGICVFVEAGVGSKRGTIVSLLKPCGRPDVLGGRWRHEVVGVIDEDEKLFDAGDLQDALYLGGAAHDGEVVAVRSGVFVLAKQFA